MGGVDVLLGHSLFMALDPKQQAKARPYPPLGTLYAAALLREMGWRVAVFDAMLAADESAFEHSLQLHRPRLVALIEDSFNFYSKMCLTRMRQAALEMVAAATARGVPVLVAGSDATDDPAAFLAEGARAVLLGEAENTLAALSERLLSQTGAGALARVEVGVSHAEGLAVEAVDIDLSDIAGLALPDGHGGVERTPARAPEREPDRFPEPARDLVDMAAYRELWREAHGTWSLNIVSTRGCPFHCNWCAKPIWGQRYAMRSPEAVADEVARLDATLRPDHLWFADDIFGLREDWVTTFGLAIEARGVRLPFTIQTRVDLVSERAAEGLARAGCAEAWLGVESGSQAVLDRMDKGIRLEQIGPAVASLRRHGIRVAFFLQLGYPGEGWEDIEATADLVRRHVPDEIGVSVSYPLPGTSFHERVAAQLGERRHWRDSHDLAMLFRGRYESDFYRRLHTGLHALLDAHRALRIAGAAGDAGGPGAAAASRAAARAQIDTAEAAWRALARDERDARRSEPTLLPLQPPSAAPDLAHPAN
jgi:anaerobic magnesium-protoporphyrin IX monomethyl ester cyclase